MDDPLVDHAEGCTMSQEPEQKLRQLLGSLATWGLGDHQVQDLEDKIRELLPSDANTPAQRCSPESRYHLRHEIGRGGMGRVLHASDQWLDREIAWKEVLKPEDPEDRARFLAEARVTCQLQHPNIVPIYDLFEEEDRVSYTMPMLPRGTLRGAIEAVHHPERAAPSGMWTIRRLVEALRQIADAVAYAHARGVIHRDLKPDNIMTGEFGEVYVADWGLSKSLGPTSSTPAADGRYTVQGGTPGYMAPEQEPGATTPVGPHTDVYQLGAMLTEITTGHTSPRPASDPTLHDLTELAQLASSVDPALRPTAAAFALRVDSWLNEARRRAEAELRLAELEQALPDLERARERTEQARQRAAAIDTSLAPWAPVEQRRALWDAEAEVERWEARVQVGEQARLRGLQDALEMAPALTAARAEVAASYIQEHRRAEASGDQREARLTAELVRRYGAEQHRSYLSGEGRLSLLTSPPGARVLAQRYTPDGRRLALGPAVSLGTTPLDGVSLAMGSYLLTLQAHGRSDVHYPVHIARCAHWTGIAPDEQLGHAIYLPTPDELHPAEAYVPAGWFEAGSLRDDLAAPPARVWVEGFLIRRLPVTNSEYLQWLNELWATGQQEAALLAAPRPNGEGAPTIDQLVYRLHPDHGFSLRQSSRAGQDWLPGFPVVYVDWTAAAAYARWRAERDGLSWRLPTEWEWEKAARGVDGRRFAWGDRFDHSFACVGGSRAPGEDATPLEVGDPRFQDDVSPYGVRSMVGNSADWCLDGWHHRGPPLLPGGRAPAPHQLVPGLTDEHSYRGGHWYSPPHGLASRFAAYTSDRRSTVGIRLVRTLTGGPR